MYGSITVWWYICATTNLAEISMHLSIQTESNITEGAFVYFKNVSVIMNPKNKI